MPYYRATLGFNAWTLRRHDFTADSDDAAHDQRDALDQWATDAMLEAARASGADLSDMPDAFIVLDRLDASLQIDQEIDSFSHSSSKTRAGELIAFAREVAGLTLFTESCYVADRPAGVDPDAVQADLDWLIAQDETLDGLIRRARHLIAQNATEPPEETDAGGRQKP